MTAVPLRVLVDHLAGDRGGNPDLAALYAGLRTGLGVEAAGFGHRTALAGRWDVLHLNWPEWCLRRDRGRAALAADCARFLATVALLRRRGTVVAWTAHNLWPHEVDRWGLVDRFTRALTYQIDLVLGSCQAVLDEVQAVHPMLRRAEHRVVPLAHYRGLYPDQGLTRQQARAGLGLPADDRILLSLGLVRRYKNAPALVRCFREVAGPGRFLLIAGQSRDEALSRQLRAELAGSPRARADLAFIPADRIQYYLRACDAVIVPTSTAVNSGAALLALSFDRPVVVPDRAGLAQLGETAGPGWVHAYRGGLRPQVLRESFALEPPAGSPSLAAHEPARVAALTFEAFTALTGRGDVPAPARPTEGVRTR